MDIDSLIQQVIGAAYKVHNTLGAGFLEKVYEKALMIELCKLNISAYRQYPVPVYYEGEKIDDFFADIFVEECLLLELKAVEKTTFAHEKQLINYLAATYVDDGLLINFGSSVNIKRKYRIYRQSSTSDMNDQ